ncbi:MAG: hypothetical protein H6821_07240 [Planctomycetaceae bacterium]|nr:hypothetical protein [Planctomycetales bacterium]MCB9873959.1 hypothetical protein [Planctomycetaceae bacterium]MCB9938578.1 hypothetical protein [Planctomycetaceae bacterium]HRX78149.1 hypothetical protein [Pirellulaceae bacterium]
MSDKTVRQFRVISLIGGLASVVGVGGLVAVGLTPLTYVAAKLLTQLFALLSIVGLIVSAIALVLARKGTLPFLQSPRAYIAASVGVLLPAAMVLLQFVKILQRLLTLRN